MSKNKDNNRIKSCKQRALLRTQTHRHFPSLNPRDSIPPSGVCVCTSTVSRDMSTRKVYPVRSPVLRTSTHTVY